MKNVLLYLSCLMVLTGIGINFVQPLDGAVPEPDRAAVLNI
jgi:hypothetical protein